MKDDRDDEFFTPAQESGIIEAIKKAEKNTSGEIRVHVENGHDDKDVLHRAGEVFAILGMDRTELGNGVLLYIDLKHHRFAIWGGRGIYELVPEGFWDQTYNLARWHFKNGEITEGLCRAIEQVGEKLKYYFPYRDGDVNELPDEISKGNV